jgi:predicted RNase H-like HicB family nuclease
LRAAPDVTFRSELAIYFEAGASGEAMKDAVLIGKAEQGFGAYVPDLPGCVALGETRVEVERLVQEAVAFHISDLREQGLPVPTPTSDCESIEIDAG